MELIDDGTDPNRRDSFGWTPIMRAASSGHGPVIRALRNHGADASAFDSIGWNALLEASSEGHAAAVRELIRAGADVNCQDQRHKWTPLMRAAAMGHTEVAKILLDAGADVAATDTMGSSALTMAHTGGMVRLLVDAGSALEHQDSYGFTPLMSAAMQINVDAAEALVKAGADVNAVDKEGTSVLQWLSKSPMKPADASRADLEDLLLDAGAVDELGHGAEL